MSEHLIWWVDNVEPSITETLTYTDGTAVDLTPSTVRFKMRAVGTGTLKVDQPAVIVSAVAGTLRYDWGAADVDTAGEFLVWWEVTTAGDTQDMGEALIEFRAHAAGGNSYLDLEEAKSTLELETGYADADLLRSIEAASRTIDDMTGTRFYTTASDEIRYYQPTAANVVFIDDLNTLTELATDSSGGTTYTAWTVNTDFILEPVNAALDGDPWNQIRTMGRTTRSFVCYPRSVRVTGKFGWPEVPQGVKVATGIISTQFMVQARSAPLGVISAFDGTAVRMSRFGPRIEELLAPYVRRPLIA